jgi:hypothetical protein
MISRKFIEAFINYVIERYYLLIKVCIIHMNRCVISQNLIIIDFILIIYIFFLLRCLFADER